MITRKLSPPIAMLLLVAALLAFQGCASLERGIDIAGDAADEAGEEYCKLPLSARLLARAEHYRRTQASHAKIVSCVGDPGHEKIVAGYVAPYGGGNLEAVVVEVLRERGLLELQQGKLIYVPDEDPGAGQ